MQHQQSDIHKMRWTHLRMIILKQLHPGYVRWHVHTLGHKVPASGMRTTPANIKEQFFVEFEAN
ncbi:unnamed protein product [Linum tenue]|uniref:Uncharacterized protein n=1 Tax=Linum tenue TaxID=586396 RepID=A0AAV0NJZ6_9ROSI|nr:unnamed protein product [Linum tenue]